MVAWLGWAMVWLGCAVASHADGGALKVGEPVVVGSLAVYVVRDESAAPQPSSDVKLLSEALGDGSVTITEVEGGGTVPALMAHNTGTKPVLGMAGDVVTGGKQDRVLTTDVWITPGAREDVAVNCVERSRWQAGGEGQVFRYAGRSEVALAKTVQLEKDQGATWAKVSELNALRGEAPATGTYRASMADDHTAAQVEVALQRLQGVADPKGVGIVVAVDGKFTTAELYAHPNLYAKAKDHLLRSVVMDAQGKAALAATREAPTSDEAQAWLTGALAAPPTEEGVRKEAAAEGTQRFDTRDDAGRTLKQTVYDSRSAPARE